MTRRCGDTARVDGPVLLSETEQWAKIAQLAAERSLQLVIAHDPGRPLNPVLRLVRQ